jgi:hypothetical protein
MTAFCHPQEHTEEAAHAVRTKNTACAELPAIRPRKDFRVENQSIEAVYIQVFG